MTNTPAPEHVLREDISLFTKDFVLLLICHALVAVGWSSMLLLPMYFDRLGFARAEIGELMAAASIGGLFMRPLVGWALDKFGKRATLTLGKIVLMAGMFALGTPSPSLSDLYFARILVGIGAGTLFTGFFAFVAQHIHPNRRTEGIAIFGISGLLPLALNGAATFIQPDAATINALFPKLVLPIFLATLILWRVREQNVSMGVSPPGNKPADFRFGSLFSLPLISIWIASLIFSTLVSAFMAFATLSSYGMSAQDPQNIWVWYAFGAVSVRLIASKAPDFLGPVNFVVPSIVTYGSAFIVLSEANCAWHYASAGILAGLGHGFCFPVLTSLVIGRAPEGATSRSLALFTALWEIAALSTTELLGKIGDDHGMNILFTGLGCATILSLSLWVTVEYSCRLQSSNRYATRRRQ